MAFELTEAQERQLEGLSDEQRARRIELWKLDYKKVVEAKREVTRLTRLLKKIDRVIENRIVDEPYLEMEFASNLGLSNKVKNDPLPDLMKARKTYEIKLKDAEKILKRLTNKGGSGIILAEF